MEALVQYENGMRVFFFDLSRRVINLERVDDLNDNLFIISMRPVSTPNN